MIEEVLPLVGLVLVMSINPGFGGQSYLPASTARIKRLADLRAERGLDYLIEVDGGVNGTTIGDVTEAGCDLAVSGTGVYNTHGSVAANIAALRAAMR
jgi:ribulose-phosphate 3-epimerase